MWYYCKTCGHHFDNTVLSTHRDHNYGPVEWKGRT